MKETTDSHEMHPELLHGRLVYENRIILKYLLKDGNKMTEQERQPSQQRKYHKNRNNALPRNQRKYYIMA